MLAAPKRPCRMSLPKMRGSCRLSSRSRMRLVKGAGAALTTLATGSSTTWFARRTPRLNCSLGSSIGSDTSRGAPAHALRSAASPAALSPPIQRSARRMRRCIPLEIPPDTGAFSASPAKDLLLGTPAPVPRNQIPVQTHASRAARRRLSPFCHTAVQLCVSGQPVIRRHGTCSASPKEQAGTGRRRRASSPATAPSACPCSTFPGGAKTTGCRRRWRSCRR